MTDKERLTGYNSFGGVYGVGMRCGDNTDTINAIIKRLAYYEDLEEQRRLVVLPFLPYKEVWDYSEFFDGTPYPEPYKLEDSIIGIGVSANGELVFEYDCVTIAPEQIGKTIFLSREEAEMVLAKMVKEDK